MSSRAVCCLSNTTAIMEAWARWDQSSNFLIDMFDTILRTKVLKVVQ